MDKKILHKALAESRAPDKVDLKTVRGSNSGFYKNGEVYGDSTTVCPRVALLRSHGIESPINLTSFMTFQIGFTWEEVYKMSKGPDVTEWVSDYRLRTPINPLFKAEFVGSPDHIVTLSDGSKYVVETKSISSTNKYRMVFQDNKNPSEYIAQLVSYMYYLKINKGKLAYGAFVWGSGASPNVKEVEVAIDGQHITVNGAPSEFDIRHLIGHKELLAYCIDENHVYDKRPANKDKLCGKAGNPFSCVFMDVCNKFDKEKLSTEDFVNEAKKAVDRKRKEIDSELSK